jgi:hypothetical protein
MDVVKKLAKSINTALDGGDKAQLYVAYGIFGASVLYIFYCGQLSTIGLAIGVGLVLYTLTKRDITVALVGGALAGLIAVGYSRRREGFVNSIGRKNRSAGTGATKKAKKEKFEDAGAMPEETPEGTNEDEGEGEGEGEVEEAEGFGGIERKKKAPNNGSRAEFFELGKKYKGPSEEDDSDFHLDAGTTFMNAYKSLKPEQIAAMTKDTQELMQTQRQLMSTLSTLKPLMQDGKQMMDMFQSYFGNGTASMA